MKIFSFTQEIYVPSLILYPYLHDPDKQPETLKSLFDKILHNIKLLEYVWNNWFHMTETLSQEIFT
jgi:hypothetical protein